MVAVSDGSWLWSYKRLKRHVLNGVPSVYDIVASLCIQWEDIYIYNFCSKKP